ncbi:hypothetical protein D3P96_07730 [Weissella viridescens]|uniref:Uncharacterized protein n=1 Tax=Weissella viridescens TaxID=1629 RepID=A0A3P2RAG0_WEIVI|nr:hypothetical protein [Weissella viridescens]RRG17434.1 hypothetical protein D3P96_07730 [Weissella viridescens]
MVKRDEVTSRKVLELLDMPMQTMVYWHYNVAVGWYVSISGRTYRVILDDAFSIDHIEEMQILSGEIR